MIWTKHVKKTEGQKADGSLIGTWTVENNPACEGCVYYALLGNNTEQKACHYILVEKHRRPCDPGKDCTVKKLAKRPEYDPGKWCHDGCGKEYVLDGFDDDHSGTGACGGNRVDHCDSMK